MQTFILRRFAQAILAIIGVTIVVFFLIRLSGDPVATMMPPEATAHDYEVMRATLGMDKPLYVQYWKFFSGIFRGDFGTSLRYSQPSIEVFMERFPNTALLATAAMLIASIIGIPMGIISAVKANSWIDNFGKIFALLGQAMPVFWVGLMLILILAVRLHLLPVAGMGDWKNLVMPAFTLGWFSAASLLRMTRSSMLDVLDAEYIKLARIKGVPGITIVLKHALKNATIPIITLGTINFVTLLTGTVITETIFAWPGVGRLVVESIGARDFPMIQASVLIFAFMFVFANLFLDVLYAYLDPRIRYR